MPISISLWAGVGVHPGTGSQSIAGQHRHTHNKQPCTHSLTPKGNLERPINLKVMLSDCGGKSENPHMHRENMQTSCSPTYLKSFLFIIVFNACLPNIKLRRGLSFLINPSLKLQPHDFNW
ncbi:hypothetical protein CHARACLAT_022928 [Characodon lateralis]|uniref:Uncharacterized protein n=1 Tax=Characodon lateralis TaxID=208331 RepID=A0ABU7DTF9_9TELE|nr:hypothetical protein [Characodon lateralis]